MDVEAPFRKYVGSPESLAWKTTLTFYQTYIYPEETEEKESAVRWLIQEETYTWLSSMFGKIDFKAWDNIRKTVGRENPTKEYSR